MLRNTTFYFSLLTFMVQIFHVSFYGILVARSAPTYAETQPLSMQEVLGGISTPGYDHQSGTANFANGVELGRGELFGLDAERAANDNHFDADQAYQKENRLTESAETLNDRINRNTVGSETDYDVKAWNTLKGSMGNQEKLNSDDTLMVDSDNILRDVANSLDDPNSDFFSACVTETNTHNVTREYIGKMKYQCSEPDRTNLNHCEIKRELVYPVKKIAGSGSIVYIDDHTLELTIGSAADQSMSGPGSCSIHERRVEFWIRDDIEIEKAWVSEVWWDDDVRIQMNDVILWENIQHRYPRPNDRDPTGFPNTNAYCQNHSSYYRQLNVDVTSHMKQAMAANNNRVNFLMRVAVNDGGEGKTRLRVRTKNKVAPREHIEQYPVGCAAQLGYVQPENTCDVLGTPDDEIYINPQCDNPLTFGNGKVGAMCKFDGWECVDTGYYNNSFGADHASSLPITLPGVTMNPKVCTKVNAVGYSCDPLPNTEICGRPNWPESDEIVCTTFKDFNDQIPDRCTQYRENPDCALVSTESTFIDPVTGKSYVTESTYECNIYTDASYEYITEEDLCTGEMKCVSGDCRFSPEETNGDFEKAMAVFKMLEDIKQNMECENPDDISTCRVFNGEASYCGKEKTGMGLDCCTLSAGQTNMFDYIKGVMHKYSMEQSTITMEQAAKILVENNSSVPWGTWASDYPRPITNTVNYVTESFSNTFDHLLGNTSGEIATESATESFMDLGIEKAMDQMKQQVFRAVYDILPDAVRDVIFTITKDTAGGSAGATVIQINPAITGAFSAIMWVYVAYQLTKLAITVLSECDDLEMGMGMKIERGQCIYTSKKCHKDTPFGCFIERYYYCCYPSPLGRIIMEQAAPQLGLTIDARQNLCKGMTIEQMSNLDWDEIDLTEWENLVLATGIAVDHNDLDIDTLSSQPWMTNASERLDPVTLNQERFEKSDIADNLKGTHDAAVADNLDCSVYPRPPACESPLSIIDSE